MKVKEFLKEHCRANGLGTADKDLEELLLGADTVYRGPMVAFTSYRIFRRVVRIGERFIGFMDFDTTGCKFDWSSVNEVEPYQETITKYKPAARDITGVEGGGVMSNGWDEEAARARLTEGDDSLKYPVHDVSQYVRDLESSRVHLRIDFMSAFAEITRLREILRGLKEDASAAVRIEDDMTFDGLPRAGLRRCWELAKRIAALDVDGKSEEVAR